MMPPAQTNINDDDTSQSFGQLLHKFKQSRHSEPGTTPPPPYRPIPSQDPVGDYDDDYDDDDNYDHDYEDVRPTNNPITINLNSSIQIKGDGNTILLAPAQQPQPQSSSTASPNQCPTRNAPLHSKLSNAMASILATLERAGALASASGSNWRSPVHINIDAGVRVDGVGNVVCLGATRLARAVPGSAVRIGGSPSRYTDRDGNHQNDCGRKRRASSEPAFGSEAKRYRRF
ncbi:hypothetical protein BJX61DRAFT_260058 [Aspergillus egyptiacus]|nr:hypothetical protein BJX61DRAFT_260058 [Aspergillus egyptiacus]